MVSCPLGSGCKWNVSTWYGCVPLMRIKLISMWFVSNGSWHKRDQVSRRYGWRRPPPLSVGTCWNVCFYTLHTHVCFYTLHTHVFSTCCKLMCILLQTQKWYDVLTPGICCECFNKRCCKRCLLCAYMCWFFVEDLLRPKWICYTSNLHWGHLISAWLSDLFSSQNRITFRNVLLYGFYTSWKEMLRWCWHQGDPYGFPSTKLSKLTYFVKVSIK
jgi:hypothetical protein